MVPLRIGYVLKRYPRLSETFILNEILALEARGIDIEVFSILPPNDGRFHPELSRVKATVNYLPPFTGSSTVQAFHALSSLEWAGVRGLDRALSFLDCLAPDRRAVTLIQGLKLAEQAQRNGLNHLHAHFMTVAAHTSYIAHIFTGISFTVTAHAKDIYRDTVNTGAFGEIAHAAGAVVTVCDANRRYIDERLLKGAPANVVRVYNGLPLDKIADEERDLNLILATGRLVEKKGFDVLLDACGLLLARGVRFHCVIIGEGEERDTLLAQRNRLGLQARVEITGAMSHDKIMSFMRRARILAAPCLTGSDGNRDALPTVLLEALALGLPAVSTTVGGIPEIVSHEREGLLTDEGDPRGVADALERLLQDERLWRRLSRAGPRKASANFDQNVTIPALIDVFETARGGMPAEESA